MFLHPNVKVWHRIWWNVHLILVHPIYFNLTFWKYAKRTLPTLLLRDPKMMNAFQVAEFVCVCVFHSFSLSLLYLFCLSVLTLRLSNGSIHCTIYIHRKRLPTAPFICHSLDYYYYHETRRIYPFTILNIYIENCYHFLMLPWLHTFNWHSVNRMAITKGVRI